MFQDHCVRLLRSLDVRGPHVAVFFLDTYILAQQLSQCAFSKIKQSSDSVLGSPEFCTLRFEAKASFR